MSTRPSRERIVAAQEALIRTLPWEVQERPLDRCWACCITCDADSRVQRAHIVARQRGGSFDPSNFFLLCLVCHNEQPDNAPVEVQVRWLRTHESSVERTTRRVAPVLARFKRGEITEDEAKRLVG